MQHWKIGGSGGTGNPGSPSTIGGDATKNVDGGTPEVGRINECGSRSVDLRDEAVVRIADVQRALRCVDCRKICGVGGSRNIDISRGVECQRITLAGAIAAAHQG